RLGRRRRLLRHGLREGELARRVCRPGARKAARERDAPAARAEVASEGDRRASTEVDESRRSRILGSLSGADSRRGAAIALLSTLAFLVVVVVVVANAPGWPTVHSQFFSWHYFKSTFPEIARAFLLNCKIFLISECLILPFALLIAILRSLPGPVFF